MLRSRCPTASDAGVAGDHALVGARDGFERLGEEEHALGELAQGRSRRVVDRRKVSARAEHRPVPRPSVVVDAGGLHPSRAGEHEDAVGRGARRVLVRAVTVARARLLGLDADLAHEREAQLVAELEEPGAGSRAARNSIDAGGMPSASIPMPPLRNLRITRDVNMILRSRPDGLARTRARAVPSSSPTRWLPKEAVVLSRGTEEF
jgi:hypothetical protein